MHLIGANASESAFMTRDEGFGDRLRQTFELYADSDVESARIRAEHLSQLVRLTPLLMAANLIAGSLVWLAVGRSGGIWLVGWLGVIAVLAALGLAGWWGRRRRAATQVSSRGYRRGTWHAALLGLCWGLAAALWFAPAAPAERVLIATLVTGMLGAGAFALAMLPWASLTYAWLIVAGALVALWRAGDPIFLAVAVLLLSYATVVSFAAMALARQSTALLRARFSPAIRERGLVIVGEGGERSVPLRATTEPGAVAPADLVLVQCKAHATRAVSQIVAPLMAPGALAVSFQNGLGNEEINGGSHGSGAVLGGLTSLGATLEALAWCATTPRCRPCSARWQAGSRRGLKPWLHC